MCRTLKLAIVATCLADITCGGAEVDGRAEAGVPFTVSKETTYITQPRTPNGLIDYAAALNESARTGVTPETNAAVLFFQAFGPEPDGVATDAQFFHRMGMKKPAEEGQYFVTYDKYLQKVLGISEGDSRYSECVEERKKAMERPWEAGEYPTVVNWLEANSKPLALIVEGTKRPKYFSPIVVSRWSPELSPSLINASLPELKPCRSASRALIARAFLSVGEEKVEQAWSDLQAAQRLGIVIGRGPTLIHGLVGISIESVVIQAIPPLVDSVQPKASLAQRWLRDVDCLPPPPNMIQKVAIADRYAFLDVAQRLAIDTMAIDEFKPHGDQHVAWQVLEGLQRQVVQWDAVMRIGNQWYDRMAEVMVIRDPQKRRTAIRELEKDLQVSGRDVALWFFKGSTPRRDVGESMGHLLASVLVPVPAAQVALDRIVQLRQNVRLTLALAAYRADEGHYPDKLDALAPRYLDQVPRDIFGGEPLRYRRTAAGYLLYSIGDNVRDDGGRPYDGKSDAYDLVVRMP